MFHSFVFSVIFRLKIIDDCDVRKCSAVNSFSSSSLPTAFSSNRNALCIGDHCGKANKRLEITARRDMAILCMRCNAGCWCSVMFWYALLFEEPQYPFKIAEHSLVRDRFLLYLSCLVRKDELRCLSDILDFIAIIGCSLVKHTLPCSIKSLLQNDLLYMSALKRTCWPVKRLFGISFYLTKRYKHASLSSTHFSLDVELAISGLPYGCQSAQMKRAVWIKDAPPILATGWDWT